MVEWKHTGLKGPSCSFPWLSCWPPSSIESVRVGVRRQPQPRPRVASDLGLRTPLATKAVLCRLAFEISLPVLSTDESFVHPWNRDRVPYAETSPHKAVSSRGLKLSPNCIVFILATTCDWIQVTEGHVQPKNKWDKWVKRASNSGSHFDLREKHYGQRFKGVMSYLSRCPFCLKHVSRRARRKGCGETSRAQAANLQDMNVFWKLVKQMQWSLKNSNDLWGTTVLSCCTIYPELLHNFRFFLFFYLCYRPMRWLEKVLQFLSGKLPPKGDKEQFPKFKSALTLRKLKYCSIRFQRRKTSAGRSIPRYLFKKPR